MTTNNNNKNSPSDIALSPCVCLWAQRADKLFLTIEIEDCKDPVIKLEKEQLYFKGKSDSIQHDADHREHEVTIDFFKPINTDESNHAVRARSIEFVIIKEEAEWWPRLLKDSKKRHWVKIDFPKWKDEDDSEDEMAGAGGGLGGQPELSDLMQQLSGSMGGAGMGGLGGPDGDEEEFESDDDDTEQSPPELEE